MAKDKEGCLPRIFRGFANRGGPSIETTDALVQAAQDHLASQPTETQKRFREAKADEEMLDSLRVGTAKGVAKKAGEAFGLDKEQTAKIERKMNRDRKHRRGR